MADTACAVDPDALARARGLLERPARRERTWPVLAAAAGLALSALVFATAMLAEPPLTTEHLAQSPR